MAKACCCCLSLKKGTKVVAVYTILLSIFIMLVFLMMERGFYTTLKELKDHVSPAAIPSDSEVIQPQGFEKNDFQNNPISINSVLQTGEGDQQTILDIIMEKMTTAVNISFGMSFAIYALWMFSALLLLVGVGCKLPSLALPYMCCTVYLTCSFIVGLIEVILVLAINFFPIPVPSVYFTLALVVSITVILINIYCCWCVWSYYLEQRDRAMEMGKEYRVPLTEVNVYKDEPIDEFTFKQKQ